MNHLKELRSSKGVSQQIVAEYLGISRQAYSNYENGNREPDFETLLKLGEFFNCSVDYILRGENVNPIETEQTKDKNIIVLDKNTNKDIIMIARAGKKMTGEQAELVRKYAQYMFPEAFDDDDT